MRYVSLLRGINVSGQKKIRMADLECLYESLGFRNVTSYIQSGNVVFDTAKSDRERVRHNIERAIEKSHGFRVPVLLRTADEMVGIVSSLPFTSVEANRIGSSVLVTFFSQKPSNDQYAELHRYAVPPEELLLRGQEAYLYCPNGYGKTKLSNAFLERKLGLSASTRNWKTVRRLSEMASDRKE